MYKKEELLKSSEDFLFKRIKPNLESLEKHVETNKELIVESFIKKLNKLFDVALLQQAAAVKEPIEYIYISFLRSSILTERYEFKIDLFSEMLWMDKEETSIYWTLKFIFQYVEKDMEDMNNFVKRKIPQFDLEELKYEYASCYIPFARLLINKTIKEVLPRTKFNLLKTDESVKVMFGGYMEKGEIIHMSNSESE